MSIFIVNSVGWLGPTPASFDEGEKQAIALAKSYTEDILLLIDERAGREVANRMQIPITGLVGILIKFKEKKEIQSISTIVEKLRQYGYWLSDEVIELAKKLAGVTFHAQCHNLFKDPWH